jgi:GT2 family glycosyltransferase
MAFMEHFSVVIVNWNAGAVLRRCVDAVFGSEGGDPQQVILVDNASTDESLASLGQAYPTVEIVRNAANVGSRAR